MDTQNKTHLLLGVAMQVSSSDLCNFEDVACLSPFPPCLLWHFAESGSCLDYRVFARQSTLDHEERATSWENTVVGCKGPGPLST